MVAVRTRYGISSLKYSDTQSVTALALIGSTLKKNDIYRHNLGGEGLMRTVAEAGPGESGGAYKVRIMGVQLCWIASPHTAV